jgi:hypothetical protein
MADDEMILYMVQGCGICQRAFDRLTSCERIREHAVLVPRYLDYGAELPDVAVGVPSVMLDGEVVAVGTPDCCELARRLWATEER